MKTITSLLAAVALVAVMAGPASADVIFDDIYYWMPDGSTMINPGSNQGQANALVKIQELVYDDFGANADLQARNILQNNLNAGLIHGPAIPAGLLNVYAYSITNMGYDDTANGGISGFNIPDNFGVPTSVTYGPNAAVDWWDTPAGNSGPGNWEWDIDKDKDGIDGDGTGIITGSTFNGFMIVVPDGTQHGLAQGAWVHNWNGEGMGQRHIVGGSGTSFMVSAPIPAPGAGLLCLVGIGMVGWVKRRMS